MNFLKSWPGAVCQSSNSAQLSAACPFPHPPVPTPSSIPRHPPGADVSAPDTHVQSPGWHPLSSCKSHTHLSLCRRAAFYFHPGPLLLHLLGRSLWSREEKPVQTLLRNTLGPAATTYIVDIYLKDLFLYFFKMLFPMLKECCLQCKAKCF